MRKPNFGVTTLVLCLLFGIGVSTRLLEPFVPPLPTNRLEKESAPFLRQAMRSIVDWYPMSEDAFARARREGKLIMLVVGVPSSSLGWTIENQILNDTDAASFINRHFVCVRVDAEDSPQWLSVYRPLSRTLTGLQRGYQIWFLTPDGKYFGDAANFGTIGQATWVALLDILEDELNRYSNMVSGNEMSDDELAQAKDVEILRNAPLGGLPDFQTQIQALSAVGNAKTGGFPTYSRIALHPNAFRFIQMLGDSKAFEAWMDPLIRQPIVDWMDGGFFVALNIGDGNLRPDYDKNALENAELMQVLAQASITFKNDLYRRLALRSFDYFMRQWDEDGFVWSSRLSDVRADARSPSVSFPPRALRESLSGPEQEFARDQLGLRVETNPAMTVVLHDPATTLADQRFAEVIDKLKGARKTEPKYSGSQYLDVNATVLARMIVTARILGDDERLKAALPYWNSIENFRVADDVVRSLGREDPPTAYLGDYLAYSDVALQVFLASGNAQAFRNGLRVLLRAKEIFETDQSGLWNMMIRPPREPGPVNVMVPEILDIYKESATASVIRLFNNYSRLDRDANVGPKSARAQQALQLSQTSFNAMSRFASLSGTLAFFASGYFCAALSVVDDGHIITVGPNSVKLATELARRLPNRLIAPAIGDVRPDLQKQKAGVYVISGNTVTGPMTVNEAVLALPSMLRFPTP